MSSNLIMGESADEIAQAILNKDVLVPDDGSAQLSGKGEPNGAFVRALMRAEAELLVADALAMKVGTYVDRTQGQRRHDALLLILHRLAEHARAA